MTSLDPSLPSLPRLSHIPVDKEATEFQLTPGQGTLGGGQNALRVEGRNLLLFILLVPSLEAEASPVARPVERLVGV